MPKVSFVIPFYNNGETINEAVYSALGQSFRDFDIWIINDGSTEAASLKKLEELGRNEKIKIIHQENYGPSVARNNAIAQTHAEIIVPLDADDRIVSGALEKGVVILERDNNIGVVYGNNNLFGERTGLLVQEPFDIQKALLYNQVAMCSFIRKKVFEKSGYLDEYMSKPGLEDWEFWIRITEEGWKMEYVPEIFFEIRVVGTSRTFEVANKNLEELKKYVHHKHSAALAREYEKLYYQNKMLKETPDFRAGNWLLSPYRFIKKLVNR